MVRSANLKVLFLLGLGFTIAVGFTAVGRSQPTSQKAISAVKVQAEETSLPAAVEMTVADMHPGKPPMLYMAFNVTLRNQSTEPRWFILPEKLPVEGERFGNVDQIDIGWIKGQGRVVMADFSGEGYFQAFLLPAKATVKLKNVSISYWGDWGKAFEDLLPIEAIVAKDIVVGDKSMQALLGKNTIGNMRAIADVTQKERIREYNTPGSRKVGVKIAEEQRLTVRVDMSKK